MSVVDEASMVATADLGRILTRAYTAGAKVVIVGDHHQLGAVGAGGVLGLLTDTGHAQTLTGLWRFQHRWEAEAFVHHSVTPARENCASLRVY